jgi:hypothetical protein
VSLFLLVVSASAAAAPPAPAASLPDGCRRFKVDVVQSGSVPLFGGEEERFRVLGTLEDGSWTGVEVTVVSDPKPDDPLWAEGEWPFPLGGDRTRGVTSGPAPTVSSQASGWRYVWRRDGMTYQVDADLTASIVRRERFTLPDKVSSEAGWAKDIVWERRHTELGWPEEETLTLVAGRGLFRVQLDYRLSYRELGPCQVGEADTLSEG